ncbi:hypothetical protein [Stieleria sp.]|uniref:hypothetical protein n=1 Tax=Stieleria sp. TaxID=2795976 RepID=UPI0035670BDB
MSKRSKSVEPSTLVFKTQGRTMSRIDWKDSPHEKVFWISVIVIAIMSLLIFAKTVAGTLTAML